MIRANLLKMLYSSLVLMVIGCASSVTIVRDTSQPAKPRWIDNAISDEAQLYFVGISTDASSLEDGVEAATKAAVSKAASYIGVNINSQFKEKSTEFSTEIASQVTAKSAASIVGAKVVETYYEKVTREEGSYKIEKYDVYVLIKMEKASAEKERQRQENEKLNKAALAYKLFLEANAKAERKDYVGAKIALLTAKMNLENIDGNVSLGNSSGISTSGELLVALQEKINKVTESMRRVSLSVTTNYGDEGNKIFSSNLAMLLTKHGFNVTSPEDAHIKIKASATVNKKGIVMGMEAYSASGEVVGASAINNHVEISIAFNVNGFHQTEHQAALNALDEAGKEAGEKYAVALIKKEEELIHH